MFERLEVFKRAEFLIPPHMLGYVIALILVS